MHFNQTIKGKTKEKDNTNLELQLQKRNEEFEKEKQNYLRLREKTEENLNRSRLILRKFEKENINLRTNLNGRFNTLNVNTSIEIEKLQTKINQLNENIGLKMDCLELFNSGYRASKTYTIRPLPNTKFKVFCDQNTGGGWTVIQRRVDKSVSFDRPWSYYKKGFGDLNGNFWLGNDYLHALSSLTGERQELRVDIETWGGLKMYATYSRFSVANESKQFELELGDYGGNAADAALMYTNTMNRMKFSTLDRDNDKSAGKNCASKWSGGWWFNDCFEAFLNGPYEKKSGNSDRCSNIHWFHTRCENSIRKSEMKVRRLYI